MDPFLTELRASLDRLGYVTVPHGDHLCVRLPLFASVRIYSTDAGIRMAPQFGPFGRTSGLAVTSTASAGVVGATVFTLGVTPLAFFAGFLGVIALAHDACRFVLTESCISRLQQVIGDLQRGGGRLTAPPLREIGREHGVEVVAQPAGRAPVTVDRPGQ